MAATAAKNTHELDININDEDDNDDDDEKDKILGHIES